MWEAMQQSLSGTLQGKQSRPSDKLRRVVAPPTLVCIRGHRKREWGSPVTVAVPGKGSVDLNVQYPEALAKVHGDCVSKLYVRSSRCRETPHWPSSALARQYSGGSRSQFSPRQSAESLRASSSSICGAAVATVAWLLSRRLSASPARKRVAIRPTCSCSVGALRLASGMRQTPQTQQVHWMARVQSSGKEPSKTHQELNILERLCLVMNIRFWDGDIMGRIILKEILKPGFMGNM